MPQGHHLQTFDDKKLSYLDLVEVVLKPMSVEYRIAWLRAYTPKTAALLGHSRRWEIHGAEEAS